MRILIFCCLLILTGCLRGPSCPIVTHQRALRWSEIFEGRILKVWDGLTASKDPKVSHLIEVEITGGDSLVGKRLAFPYDEWSTGKAPPDSQTTVVFSPMQWVQVDPRSMGRPKDGW
jgi:hypothetical protein